MIKLTQDEVRFVKTQIKKYLQSGRLDEVVKKLTKEDKNRRIFMFLLEHKVPLFRAFNNIPREFFKGTEVSSIVIPKNVKSIGEKAFANCEHLTSVVIEDGVEKIGDYAFLGDKALTKVDIPESVYKLGVGAFGGCVSLKEVTIPDSVTILPKELFEGADGVTIYANSRKSLNRGMKLRCPNNEVEFYNQHLKMKSE